MHAPSDCSPAKNMLWEQQRAAELGAASPVARSRGRFESAVVHACRRLAAPRAAEVAALAIADEAYIETVRCSSCNECTLASPKMFAYDDNKQAYITDLKAGTYRQLVEAAESCQVSVIHPGKPWNAGEPGLGELIERAESFR